MHVNVICGVLRLVVVAVPTDDRPHPMTAQGLSKVQAASKTVTPGQIAIRDRVRLGASVLQVEGAGQFTVVLACSCGSLRPQASAARRHTPQFKFLAEVYYYELVVKTFLGLKRATI